MKIVLILIRLRIALVKVTRKRSLGNVPQSMPKDRFLFNNLNCTVERHASGVISKGVDGCHNPTAQIRNVHDDYRSADYGGQYGEHSGDGYFPIAPCFPQERER